jgi:diguanylate cyclase (GGDEF)-like protein
MPEADRKIGLMVGERLRAKVAEGAVPVEGKAQGLPITISVGVAAAEEGIEDMSGLIRAADEALYRAKQNGRNRVEGPP